MNEKYMEIQVAHNRLLFQYSQLVKDVGRPGNGKLLQVFTEDHIRRILLELIKSYTVLIVEMRLSSDKPTSSLEWLALAVEDSQVLVERLVSFQNTFSSPFRIIKSIAVIIVGYFLYSIYGEVTGLFELLEDTRTLTEFINQNAFVITGWMNILLIPTGMFFIALVVDSYFRKRALFGDPEKFYYRYGYRKDQVNIYALENLLFCKIDKRKPREFPVDLVSSFIFFVLLVLLAVVIGGITKSIICSSWGIPLMMLFWGILSVSFYRRRFTRGNY